MSKYLQMLTTADTTQAYNDALASLTQIGYRQFARELYGLKPESAVWAQQHLLLMLALNSWDGRPGADNILTPTQILQVMSSLYHLKNTACTPALGSPSADGSAVSPSLDIQDTASVDMSLSNSVLSAAVKISAAAGNQATLNADGVFVPAVPAGGGTLTHLLVKGVDFTDAVTYNNAALADKQPAVWHRGLGYLIYNKDDANDPLNEYSILPEGGIAILIPGFDAQAGDNYFYIIYE